MRRENTIGDRIRHYRLVAGMSQEQLANAVGISRPYLSQIENGVRAVDSRRLCGDFAFALGVEVVHLTAPPAHRPGRPERALRQSVPDIRSALDAPTDLGIEPADLDRQIDRVMAARMACDYSALGRDMPGVIGQAVLNAHTHSQQSLRAVARVCSMASLALRPIGYEDLAMRLAERARAAATAAGDDAGKAAAVFAAAQSAMAGGTEALRQRALDMALTGLNDINVSNDETLTWAGFLHLEAGRAAASLGHVAVAVEHNSEALTYADRLAGADPWRMELTKANVGAWNVAMFIEAEDYGAAIESARKVDRSKLRTHQRRAHLYAHMGKAFRLAGRHSESIAAFAQALAMAESEVAWRTSTRESVRQLVLTAPRSARGIPLQRLAAAVNVDAVTGDVN